MFYAVSYGWVPLAAVCSLRLIYPQPAEGPPRIPRPRGGSRMLRGLMLGVKKFLVVLIYSKYKMNKHVESLSKVDKSITFHYCTVMCDVLRPIDVILLKRQHKLYRSFCVLNFFKVGKFATFSERSKAKSVFSFRWLCPLIP